VNLVCDHVVKLLVVYYAYEDVCNEFFTAGAVVKDFAACMAEPEFNKVFANFVWSFVGERCAVSWFSSCCGRFA
jgi:hypothetical protein